MQEILQKVQDRKARLDKKIAEREADISRYRAEAEKLRVFLDLAEELFSADTKAEDAASDSVQHLKQQVRDVMPVRPSA